MHNQPGGAPPVFVDRTGRRRRLAVVAGTVAGLGLLTSLGLILAGLFLDSPVPLPGWPDPKGRPPIEAGVGGPSAPATGASPSHPPRPAASTAAPTASPTATPSTSAARPTAAAPRRSEVPGQGDERRNSARPSHTPGKP